MTVKEIKEVITMWKTGFSSDRAGSTEEEQKYDDQLSEIIKWIDDHQTPKGEAPKCPA